MRPSKKKANIYVNYQQRASEFDVGDMALPFYANTHQAGRVVAVYPAIGMVDVEFPQGSKRFPVEELQLIDPSDYWINGSHNNTVPGRAGTVPVSGGPYDKNPNKYLDFESGAESKDIQDKKASRRKRALYWKMQDRKYYARKDERENSCFHCPRCKEIELKKCVYKRETGKSLRLLGCPSCLFLIKRTDIINCEEG